MKRTRMILMAAGAALMAAGVASAQLPWKGYLGETAPDTTFVIAPAPQPGSPQAEADRAIFKATRALEGTPRWEMAIADSHEREIGKAMACALGAEISMASTPKLYSLLLKFAPDLTTAVDRPKAYYARKRPYLVDEGNICVPRSDALAASPDYPSGHASWGWGTGLILAELAPDRAAQILRRARAFGESRVVCGVHNASSVAAGRDNGTAVVAALHGLEAFRKDMVEARAELDELRARSKPPERCAAEEALVAQPAW